MGASDIRAGGAFVELNGDASGFHQAMSTVHTSMAAFGQGVATLGAGIGAIAAGISAPLLIARQTFLSVASDIGRKRIEAAFNVSFSSDGGSFAKIKSLLESVGAVASKALVKSAEKTKDMITIAREGFRVLMAEIGGTFAPLMQRLAGVFSFFIDKAQMFVRSNRGLIQTLAKIGGISAIVSVSLIGIGLAIQTFASTIGSFKLVITSGLNPALLVMAAVIGVLLVRYTSLGDKLKATMPNFHRFIMVLTSGVSAIKQFIRENKELITTIAKLVILGVAISSIAFLLVRVGNVFVKIALGIHAVGLAMISIFRTFIAVIAPIIFLIQVMGTTALIAFKLIAVAAQVVLLKIFILHTSLLILVTTFKILTATALLALSATKLMILGIASIGASLPLAAGVVFLLSLIGIWALKGVGAFKLLANVIKSSIGKITNLFKLVGLAWSIVFDDTETFLSKVFKALFSSIGDDFSEVFGSMISKLSTAFQSISQMVVNGFTKGFNRAKERGKEFIGGLGGDSASLLEKIGLVVAGIGGVLDEMFGHVLRFFFAGKFKQGFLSLAAQIKVIFLKVALFIQNLFNRVMPVLLSGFSKLATLLDPFLQQLFHLAAELNKIFRQILGAMGAVAVRAPGEGEREAEIKQRRKEIIEKLNAPKRFGVFSLKPSERIKLTAERDRLAGELDTRTAKEASITLANIGASIEERGRARNRLLDLDFSVKDIGLVEKGKKLLEGAATVLGRLGVDIDVYIKKIKDGAVVSTEELIELIKEAGAAVDKFKEDAGKEDPIDIKLGMPKWLRDRLKAMEDAAAALSGARVAEQAKSLSAQGTFSAFEVSMISGRQNPLLDEARKHTKELKKIDKGVKGLKGGGAFA